MNEKQRTVFVISLSRLIEGVISGSLDERLIKSRLESGIKYLNKIDTKQPKLKKSVLLEASMTEVHEVFGHWKDATNRPTARLTIGRKTTIRARLRDFSVEQLNHITDWAVADPHYSGENDRDQRYDWPENMFRSTARVEHLLEKSNWSNGSENVTSIDVARDIRRLEEEAEEARERGQFEQYNSIQERIRIAKNS
jgi:hypothetical protein